MKPVFNSMLAICVGICLQISMMPHSQAQTSAAEQISFEKNPETTATYQETMAFYQNLDQNYDQCKLLEYGNTDFGEPLRLLVLSKDKIFDPQAAKASGKLVLLINNGIHPGEPEGIDASMMLARDLLKADLLPKNMVICIIPVYNVGGMNNRGRSRANQNGPEAYGFRGNARNLDLNRDFIKTDSRNSRTFQEIFQTWQPDVFMDTHTSNGADYQYIMTLIDTQRDKLHPELAELAPRITGELYNRMEKSGFPMVPYVSFRGRTPESGIVSFMEGPRYSTGYAALHHTIGYMPETHMLKTYAQRVHSTYALLNHYIQVSSEQAEEIKSARKMALEASRSQKRFTLTYTLDTNRYEEIDFMGFESGSKPSEVSGQPRLFYDRDKPFTRKIRYYNRYKPVLEIEKPQAYVIPQAWHEVISLLQLNGVKVQQLERDTLMELDMYYITDFQTARAPYEGHYNHSQVKLRTERQQVQFYKGDYLVYMDQAANRYVVETLEPQAPDSFFNWNFFDSILSRKEYFSAYVFEDEAAQILRDNPELRAAFEEAKASDEQLRSNAQAQLSWIHSNSDYAEKTHMRYPIGRLP
ncbi:MAG TPA: M14 family zinc carboxypeptidase [Sphingobacteriaceae bacterium]|nr:M14 family zinc carboxypeptidase [Sphingobacteriaceae bacterium]